MVTSIISSKEHITVLNVEIVAIQILHFNWIYFVLLKEHHRLSLAGGMMSSYSAWSQQELGKMNKYIKSTCWHS